MPKKSTRFMALRGVIKTAGLTVRETAEEIGTTYGILQNMMLGNVPWKLEIVLALCNYFELNYNDIPYYFQEAGAPKLPTSTFRSERKKPSGRVIRLAR